MFKKPHFTIWLTIPILLGLSLIGTNSTIDIQMHDTYFVIAIFHLAVVLAILLSLIGLLYWLMRNKLLIRWMTVTHVFVTIVGFVGIMLSTLQGSYFSHDEKYGSYAMMKVNTALFFLILGMGLVQVLFLVNLGIGLVRGSKN